MYKFIIMKTTTISILRSNIKSYIDGVINNGEPVLVNKGSDGAVIISLTTYNELTKEKKRPLNSPAIGKNDYYVDVNIDEL